MFLPGLLKLTLCTVLENEEAVGSVVSVEAEKPYQASEAIKEALRHNKGICYELLPISWFNLILCFILFNFNRKGNLPRRSTSVNTSFIMFIVV